VRITVDASVAVKWLVEEEGRREALTLTAPRLERHAPDLLLPECANVIWKKERRGEIAAARPFIDQIAQLSEAVALHPGAELVRDAAGIALDVGHPVYDCFYIACAKLTDSVLVTSDRRLAGIVSRSTHPVTAVLLDDREAMARIEAAGVRLIISPGKVAELIEAWDRFMATWDSVLEDTFSPASSEGSRTISLEHRDIARQLVQTSPAYRRLIDLVQELNHDERVDLLVLGWSGRGEQMTRRRLFEQALRMVDQVDVNYIAHLGADWREGRERLAG
jgi:predicted nucleic acid-binding protein